MQAEACPSLLVHCILHQPKLLCGLQGQPHIKHIAVVKLLGEHGMLLDIFVSKVRSELIRAIWLCLLNFINFQDYRICRIDLFTEPQGLGLVNAYFDDTEETRLGSSQKTCSIQVSWGM